MITLAIVDSTNTVINTIVFDETPSDDLVNAIFEAYPAAVYGVQSLTETKQINHPLVTKATPLGVCVDWTVTDTDYIPPKPQENAFWDSGDRSWVLL